MCCCSITQLSTNFMSTSANTIGRSFRGQPALVSWDQNQVGQIVAAVHGFAVQCGTIALVQVPIHSRNSTPSALDIAAMSALRQQLGPGSAASTTLLAIRFTNFASGGVNFAAACLTAAHCILIHAISCSIVSTATTECTSAAVRKFCGACALVCSICKAARMLHKSVLSEARIVWLQCRALLQSARAISTRINLTRQQIAHVRTQELNPRTCLSSCRSLSCKLNTQLAPLPWRRSFVIRMLTALTGPHKQRGTQPSPSGAGTWALSLCLKRMVTQSCGR